MRPAISPETRAAYRLRPEAMYVWTPREQDRLHRIRLDAGQWIRFEIEAMNADGWKPMSASHRGGALAWEVLRLVEERRWIPIEEEQPPMRIQLLFRFERFGRVEVAAGRFLLPYDAELNMNPEGIHGPIKLTHWRWLPSPDLEVAPK